MKLWSLGLQAGFILTRMGVSTVRYGVGGTDDPSEFRSLRKVAVGCSELPLPCLSLSRLTATKGPTKGGEALLVRDSWVWSKLDHNIESWL